MTEMRKEYTTLVGNSEGRDHAEKVGVDENIILDWILRN
jgi:hypothetical protein